MGCLHRMAAVVLLCRGVLAAVFLLAALGKLRRPQPLFFALRQGGLGGRPALGLMLGLPALELGLAVGLALAPAGLGRAALVAALAVLLGFTAWLWVGYRRGQPVPCGCFGGDPSPVTGWTLLRNLLLCGLAALGAALGPQVPVRGSDAAPGLAGAALLLGLVVGAARLWPQRRGLVLVWRGAAPEPPRAR